MRESKQKKSERAQRVYSVLDELYPNVSTFLTHNNTFELLIAVILSAQCTDERVNMVTPGLFQRFPNPKALMDGPLEDIKESIKSINFFNNKSINIQRTADIIHNQYNDVVPDQLDDLIKLPGVGRKTANVVLGQAFGKPGITVDTHVKRLVRRLGFTKESDPVKVEYDLMKIWPDSIWSNFSTVLILHGRLVCKASSPKCDQCQVVSFCPKKL